MKADIIFKKDSWNQTENWASKCLELQFLIIHKRHHMVDLPFLKVFECHAKIICIFHHFRQNFGNTLIHCHKNFCAVRSILKSLISSKTILVAKSKLFRQLYQLPIYLNLKKLELKVGYEENSCEFSLNMISLFIICVKPEICEWWFSPFFVILSEKQITFRVISSEITKITWFRCECEFTT